MTVAQHIINAATNPHNHEVPTREALDLIEELIGAIKIADLTDDQVDRMARIAKKSRTLTDDQAPAGPPYQHTDAELRNMRRDMGPAQ